MTNSPSRAWVFGAMTILLAVRIAVEIRGDLDRVAIEHPWMLVGYVAVFAAGLLAAAFTGVREAVGGVRVPRNSPTWQSRWRIVGREGHAMPKITGPFAAALLVASLGAANAQTAPGAGQPQPRQDMQHAMPMQGGGMCGPGGCGTGAPAQSTPMQGMMPQGQGGMMQGGCPMMQRSAALERRVRQLEERLGIPAPPQPAQPGPPG